MQSFHRNPSTFMGVSAYSNRQTTQQVDRQNKFIDIFKQCSIVKKMKKYQHKIDFSRSKS